MPIATTTAIASGLAIAGGAAKSISGASQSKKYQKLIDGYQRQELTNPYENLKVSTMGAMMQQKNSAQNTATALYNLRRSGTNAIIGATGRVVEQNNKVNQQIAANLDQQATRNELYAAQGASRVQQMQERREEADLDGLGNALNVAKQNMWGGFSDIATGALTAAGGMTGSTGGSNQFSGALRQAQNFNVDFSDSTKLSWSND